MGVATLGRTDETTYNGTSAAPGTGTFGNIPNCWHPAQIVILEIVMASGTITCLSITGPAFLSGITWTLLDRKAGTGITSEVWLGYNIPNATGTNQGPTITLSASVNWVINVNWFIFAAPVTSAPTFSAVNASGTSATLDPGNISATAGDLVLMRGGYASATALTSYTGLAPSGKTWETIANTSGTAIRAAGGQKCAETSAAHDLSATIPNVAWVAQNITITPPAPLSRAALLYKGFDTALLDQGSPF